MTRDDLVANLGTIARSGSKVSTKCAACVMFRRVLVLQQFRASVVYCSD